VYIDDASKDGTPDTVKDYMKKYEIEQSKLLFIENT
jgi:glycosyltransferase involved in cell wall biosynthesis